MSIRICFIINPIAGSGKASDVRKYAMESLDKTRFSPSFEYTERPGHAGEIVGRLVHNAEADVVVAVGGDGTVNEVASALVAADSPEFTGQIPALAVIPMGSGNGLARHLGMSMNPAKAVMSLNSATFNTIDHGIVDGHQFFCTCGAGIDAEVAFRFAQMKGRGLLTYLKACFSIWFGYHPEHYTLRYVSDGKSFSIDCTAMLVTAGNANQWGNNAYITPLARIDDGLLELTWIKPLRLVNVPAVVYKLMRKRLYESPFAEHVRCSSVEILREKEGPAHYDGEPVLLGKSINISLIPSSLKIFRSA